MKKYWFKQKAYGYGFQPCTWEGWLATIGLVAIMILTAYVNGFFEITTTQPFPIKSGFRFLLDTIIVTTLFTVAFKDKVEGGLKWRWVRDYKIDQNKPPEPPKPPSQY